MGGGASPSQKIRVCSFSLFFTCQASISPSVKGRKLGLLELFGSSLRTITHMCVCICVHVYLCVSLSTVRSV